MKDTETLHAEETTDIASASAIEVGTKQLAKLEEKLIVPLIPETLNINGVEINTDRLAEQISQVKLMKIVDVTDEIGFENATAKLKEISKLRTSSESWRKEITKPVLAFQKELKSKVDKIGTLCADGEDYLKSIIEPIENFKESEKERINKEKEIKAEERAKQLIEIGFIYNGAGTYDFSLNGADFVLAQQLKDWNDEQFQCEYDRVKVEWDAEQERVAKVAKDKADAEAKLKTEVNLFADRIKNFRLKELKFEGYVLNQSGVYTNANNLITEADIANLTDEEWEAKLAHVEEVKPVKVETVAETVDEAIQTLEDELDTLFSGDSSFAEFHTIPDVVEEVIESEHKAVDKTPLDLGAFDEKNRVQVTYMAQLDEEVFTTELTFTKETPYIETALGTMKLRLFHTETKSASLDGVGEDKIGVEGVIKGDLMFALISE